MGRQPLMTSDGRMTQAIFGMVNMLRSLLKECQPSHIAVVMDAKGKTFRHDLYYQYKANRPSMPDDLREQLEYIKKIIPAMGLPMISIPGVEADDVIGTLSVTATNEGYRVMIVSSDKDLTQLVNDRVEMVDTMKGTRFDPQGVTDKFGVPPEKIIEFLALVGDTSDNIPGIPKVGPKTAVKWLNEFGSLDEIVQNADSIKGKVGENLRGNLDQLALSKQLTTIKCDVEVGVEVDELRLTEMDVESLRTYYEDLEFKSWLKEIAKDTDRDGEHDAGHAATPDVQQTQPDVRYETILDLDTLDAWVERLANCREFAVDTETTSIDAHLADIVGVSFAIEPYHAAYLPLSHRYTGAPEQIPLDLALNKLKPILEDSNIGKIGQNLKYDLQVFARYDVFLQGIKSDTMLVSYLLDAGNSRHDMDTLALKHLGVTTTKFSDVAGSGKNQLTFDQVEVDIASHYAAEDADITLRLHQVLFPQLEDIPALLNLYQEIELPLMPMLARIESTGVRIDSTKLLQQSAEMATSLTEIERQAYDVAGEPFNIGSPKQIQEILYEKQGIPVIRKTPKGQPSTAEEVLQELAAEHALPALILQHRSLAKLKSTYTDKLPQLVNPKTQRIHTSYHQAVAATGRLSSSNPNLQNIPIRTEQGRRIREAFVPEKGKILLAADYSQIELRIMAHLSADPSLVAAFNHGIDVHKATAAEVFDTKPELVDSEHRRRAKAINFGLIYGMSAFGLAKQLQIPQSEAKEYIEIYFERYPGVKQYMERTKEKAKEQGYVETLFSRRLNLPEINSSNAVRRKYAERTAINAPMQGTAADLIKLAMLKVGDWITQTHSQARIILQVHDELVLEMPIDELETVENMTKKLMCSVAELSVPLEVDTGSGENWKQAH